MIQTYNGNLNVRNILHIYNQSFSFSFVEDFYDYSGLYKGTGLLLALLSAPTSRTGVKNHIADHLD